MSNEDPVRDCSRWLLYSYSDSVRQVDVYAFVRNMRRLIHTVLIPLKISYT